MVAARPITASHDQDTGNGAHGAPYPVDAITARVKPDHDHLATELAKDWRNKAAFLWGNWYVYEGGVWQQRAIQRVNMAAREYLREKRESNWDVRITKGLIDGVVSLIADDLFIEDERIDRGDQYINLRNGLFNLDTMQLEPHNPDLYLTTQLDFDYDEDAECPTFRRYLRTSLVLPDTDKTDEKLLLLLQEALGYSLTANTSLKAAFWLVGKPDSGKSTLISFIRAMLGSLHTTIDLNQLATNRFMLANIAGKRAVTFTEARVNSVLPDDIFKSIVGGSDEIYADVKNRDAITFVPKAKFWWGMNDMPRVTDRSGAVFNRLHAIPFNRSIPHDQRIANLGSLLQQERAGVFVWALAGYKRLMRAGAFTRVEQSERAKEDYRLSNDTEQTFVNEMCNINPTGSISANALYNSYRNWCADNGFIPKNANQAAKEWERLGFIKRVKDGRRYWHGISIISGIM